MYQATINPMDVTNYERGERDLKLFAIYCVLSAQKDADRCARIAATVDHYSKEECPLRWAARHARRLRTGQYGRVERALLGLASLDLATASLDELLSVHGVGPKIARFFLLHSRQGAEYAVLDCHVLRWMREREGVDAPVVTPKGAKYRRVEARFQAIARERFPGWTLARVDLYIWSVMSGRLFEA
jgi:thermostable 8-oxoguanine DNA glycosylase